MNCPNCGGRDHVGYFHPRIAINYVSGLGFGDLLTEAREIRRDAIEGEWPVAMKCDDCDHEWDYEPTREERNV